LCSLNKFFIGYNTRFKGQPLMLLRSTLLPTPEQQMAEKLGPSFQLPTTPLATLISMTKSMVGPLLKGRIR
jgi:hypothetical protein